MGAVGVVLHRARNKFQAKKRQHIAYGSQSDLTGFPGVFKLIRLSLDPERCMSKMHVLSDSGALTSNMARTAQIFPNRTFNLKMSSRPERHGDGRALTGG